MGSTFTLAPSGHVFCYVDVVMWEHPQTFTLGSRCIVLGNSSRCTIVYSQRWLFWLFLNVPCFFCGCVLVGASLWGAWRVHAPCFHPSQAVVNQMWLYKSYTTWTCVLWLWCDLRLKNIYIYWNNHLLVYATKGGNGKSIGSFFLKFPREMVLAVTCEEFLDVFHLKVQLWLVLDAWGTCRMCHAWRCMQTLEFSNN